MGIMFWNLGYEVKRMVLKELFLVIQMPNVKNHSFSQNHMYNYFQIDTWKSILKRTIWKTTPKQAKKDRKKKLLYLFHKYFLGIL